MRTKSTPCLQQRWREPRTKRKKLLNISSAHPPLVPQRIFKLGFDAIKHVIFDQIRMAVVAKTMEMTVGQYFEARKATESLWSRLLRDDEFLAPMTSFVPTQTMTAITDRRIIDVFRSRSMETSDKEDAAAADEASIVPEAMAHWSFKSSSEESYEGHNSRQARHRTCSRASLNKSNKSSESVSTLSMSDRASRRKARPNHRIECLNRSESNSDHSIPRARYETHERDKAFAIISPINDCYKSPGLLHIPPCEYLESVRLPSLPECRKAVQPPSSSDETEHLGLL